MKKLDLSQLKVSVSLTSETEKRIEHYKLFYKKYLKNIKDKKQVLNQLSHQCIQFKEFEPSLFLNSYKRDEIKRQADIFISQNFSQDVYNSFTKEMPLTSIPIIPKEGQNEFYKLLSDVMGTYNTFDEKLKKEWKHKTDFLVFLNNCLFYGGLHPDIEKRDPKIYKRYNILVDHFFKSKVKQTDTRVLLSLEALQHEILNPYQSKLPIMIDGKLIPLKDIEKIKITSSVLIDDEIELFAFKHNFTWTNITKDYVKFINLCENETDTIQKNPYLTETIQSAVMRNQSYYMISINRISELKEIKHTNFDLTRLIELCEELNNVSINNNSLSASLLVRAIIDHIPPVFEFTNFGQVANNYTGGTKSFKKSMINLDNSLRNIADSNIHSQIRKKEVRTKMNQSDFSPELDLLLGEIVRILK